MEEVEFKKILYKIKVDPQERLDFKNKKFLIKQIKALMNVICGPTPVRYVCFWGSNINNDGAEIIAKSLSSHFFVTELDLGNNGIGDRGAKALAHTFLTNSVINKLNLYWNNIEVEGAKALANALKFNRSLTEINFGNNIIGWWGVNAFSEILMGHPSIQKVDFSVNYIGAGCFIKVVSATNLIREINLSSNNIGSEGIVMLAKALSSNHSIIQLNLGNNAIEDQAAKAIAYALKENTSLTDLGLCWNKIGDEGAIAFAQLLECNTPIVKIDLSANHIGFRGIRAIAKTAGFHTTAAIHVNLSNNAIDNNGKPSGELYVFRQSNAKDKKESFLNQTFELNGDDSSDEENTDIKDYSITKQWEKFKRSLNWEISGIDEVEDLRLLFITYAKGIQYLYSRSVNNFYYHNEKGKKSLGNNEIKDDKGNVLNWIKEALWETVKIVIYGGGIPPSEAEEIEVECHKEARKLKDRLHLLLKNANLRNAILIYEKEIKDIVKFIEKDEETFYKNLREHNPRELKGKKRDTILKEHKDKVSLGLAKLFTFRNKKNENNAEYFDDCVAGLLSNLKKEGLSGNKNNFILFFKLEFFLKLRTLARKYNIEIARGVKDHVKHVLSQNEILSFVFWLAEIRKSNRLHKRNIMHYYERFNNDESTGTEKIGYQTRVGRPTFWYVNNRKITYQEDTSTTPMRSNEVKFKTVSSAAYPSLGEKILKIIKSTPSLTDRVIAKVIRKIAFGENVKEDIPEDTIQFIAELTFLLFFCETNRNPASFVVHQMILDLIIEKKYSFEDMFGKANDESDDGMMPMSMKGAVACSGKLGEIFSLYMPYPYKYGGSEKAASAAMKKFISRNNQIVEEWCQLKGIDFSSSIKKLFDELSNSDMDWYNFRENVKNDEGEGTSTGRPHAKEENIMRLYPGSYKGK